MLSAGHLRHRVTIHAPAGTREVGAVDVATRVPAKIAGGRSESFGREDLAAGGVQSQAGSTVTMRFRTDVQTSYELVEHCCNARRFQILSIQPSDDGAAIEMACVTVG